MARTDGRIDLNRIAEEAEKQKLLEAWRKMTPRQQQKYLAELEKEKLANRMAGVQKENQKSADQALLKAKLAIEFLKLNGMEITPTTVSQQAKISRSYIYKNAEIKQIIDNCKEYNQELKRIEKEAKKQRLYSPTDVADSPTLNYHLHTKLIENYIHEYQTLKALNAFMEEKISDVKKQIEEKTKS